MLRRLPSIQRRAQCIFCSIGHGQAAETPQCSSSSTRRLCFTTACLCAFVLFSQSHDQLFATPWAAACQASLSLTLSRSLPKFMSIESEMPSSHLILCHPFLLPPSIFPSIRVFSSESVLHIRWPKYWTEKAVAPHSSTLAWKILWTEEPGGLQSMVSQRVGHD